MRVCLISRPVTARRPSLVVAVAFAVCLGAFEAKGTTPSPGRASVLKLGRSPVHIQLAGYSINSNTEGTVTIKVTDD